MTAVVGLIHSGVAYVGADSAGVGGLSLTVRADAKLFRKNGMVMGFTSSFRMGQLLRYKLVIPPRSPKQRLEEYMATTFIDVVRQCLADGGFRTKKDEVESGGTFIVATEGRLFLIESDFQVGEAVDEFIVCGSGGAVASGALFASRGKAPRTRIKIALEAAERMNAGVRRPFHIIGQRAAP